MSTTEETLLTAIRKALDIPLPADEEDLGLYNRTLRDRVSAVLGTTDAIWIDGLSPEATAQALRARTQQLPVTYRTSRESVGWHWGPDPAFGNLCQHVGPRETCTGPDCAQETT